MSSRIRPTEALGDFEGFLSELRRHWPPGSELTVVRTTDSTNALARRTLDAEPLETPRVFVAWEQTAGRGRRGRSWSSPSGRGLYASVLLPLHGAESLAVLPVLLPVAICEELRALGVGDCAIKWPNDLLTRGRKLGGLLIEAVATGNEPRVAILGVGVNYSPQVVVESALPAVGLVERLDRPLSLAEVTRRLLDSLLVRLSELDGVSMGDLIASYCGLSAHAAGERVVCRTADETIEGAFAGFDRRGFLRLRVEGGERRVGSGEIVEC